MNRSAFIIAALLALPAAEALAQGGMGGERGQRPEFSTLDTDANGMLSVEEMGSMNTEEQPDRASNILSRMDTDEDGSLSEEEYNTRPQRGAGGGMGGQ